MHRTQAFPPQKEANIAEGARVKTRAPPTTTSHEEPHQDVLHVWFLRLGEHTLQERYCGLTARVSCRVEATIVVTVSHTT